MTMRQELQKVAQNSGSSTVSYTHLDVYKRQHQLYDMIIDKFIITRNGQESVVGRCDETVEAVSYTHLQVYDNSCDNYLGPRPTI